MRRLRRLRQNDGMWERECCKTLITTRDNHLSKWLSHPLSRTGNVIAGLNYGWHRIRAKPAVNVILNAISSNLHALDFPSSVSTIASVRAVFPPLRLPAKVEEQEKEKEQVEEEEKEVNGSMRYIKLKTVPALGFVGWGIT